MTRTRLRPVPSGRITPARGSLFGLALGAISFAIFWNQVNPLSAWLALGGLLFYVFVYTLLAQAEHPAEHRHRRGRGRVPAAGGLGRDDRPARPRGPLPLRHHLLLDPAPLLGAGPHQAGRLRQGGRADAAGGEGRRAHQAADADLHPPAAAAHHPAGGLRRARARSTLVAAVLLGARLLWYCVALLREAGVTPTAWKMYRYSLLYLALLFVAMGIDRYLPRAHARRPRPRWSSCARTTKRQPRPPGRRDWSCRCRSRGRVRRRTSTPRCCCCKSPR